MSVDRLQTLPLEGLFLYDINSLNFPRHFLFPIKTKYCRLLNLVYTTCINEMLIKEYLGMILVPVARHGDLLDFDSWQKGRFTGFDLKHPTGHRKALFIRQTSPCNGNVCFSS